MHTDVYSITKGAGAVGSLVEQERRLLSRLAVIKLATQILDQRTNLSSRQRRLVRAALDACDELTLQLVARRQAPAARSRDERFDDTSTSADGMRDLIAPADDGSNSAPGGREVDAVVIAHDVRARKHLWYLLTLQGYGVWSASRVDDTVEHLLAERRRLVVLSPDPDVGQAEIEAQVRRLRSVAPRSPILICLERDQATRAVEREEVSILRWPFGSRALLERTAELYPAGPPRRLGATRPSS